ncbi:hypothetical protein A616_28725 [Brevibacillus brevis X23]|nr:hypothetical protein A616_28725 [Brevibacillus brevis X23]
MKVTKDMSFYWEVDYRALQKYAPSLSEELLGDPSDRSGETISGDGGLQITSADLGERIIAVEEYLIKYRSQPTGRAIRALYKDYVKHTCLTIATRQ